MRVKFPSWLSKKAPVEGSLAPLLAVMLVAAAAAGVTLWLRSERASNDSGSELSPNGTPATPLPHRNVPTGAGV